MVKVSFDKNIAIYIDSDNGKGLASAQQILEISQYMGINRASQDSSLRCYAYGNWELPSLSKWCEKIDALEIQRIQVNSGKNATDNRILIDIARTLADPNNPIAIYIIVSSDGDFASLAQPILEEEREFIGIGTKGRTSQELKNLTCYFLEDLNQHLRELENHYYIPINILRRFKLILSVAYSPMLTYYHRNEDWVSFSQIEEKIREDFENRPYSSLYEDYETIFGKHKLSELISFCSDDFEIEEERIKRIDHYPERTRLFWLEEAYHKAAGDKEILKYIPTIPVNIGKLGEILREIDRYYEDHFGGKKPSYWLRQYPAEFEVDKDYVLWKPFYARPSS